MIFGKLLQLEQVVIKNILKTYLLDRVNSEDNAIPLDRIWTDEKINIIVLSQQILEFHY
jgi:hypothetical protein